MPDSEKIPRLSRLTSILLKLQTKPFVSVKQLAEDFQISKRTVYRDIIALEASGVPIVPIEGKGYSLIEGYSIPPVMFTESEANALILAEMIIAKTKDDSLIKEFNNVTDKIKSVLKNSEKQKADFLSDRIVIGKNWNYSRTSSHLTDIQKAITNFDLLKIEYQKENDPNITQRTIEPFAIYHNTFDDWILTAWCRLRNEFRNFRIDRIIKLQKLDEKFTPHKITLAEYIEIQRKKHFRKSVT